jgi:hypothetical protein
VATGGHVSWRDLLLFLLLVIAVSAAAGGATTWWLLAHFTARVPLANQAVALKLPPDLPVRVRITGAEVDDSAAGGPAETRTIPVRLRQRLRMKATIDSQVPVKTVVPYKGEIPVSTTLHLDTRIRTRVLGIPMTLPVKADVPLDLRLPVDLRIPVDQVVHLKFTTPVTADIDQVVQVPVPAVLDSRISFLDEPLRLRILEGELRLPLDRFSIQRRAPWAPAPAGEPASEPAPPAADHPN